MKIPINTIIVSGSELKGANMPEKPDDKTCTGFIDFVKDQYCSFEGDKKFIENGCACAIQRDNYELVYNSAIGKAIPFANQNMANDILPDKQEMYNKVWNGQDHESILKDGIYSISPIECEEQKLYLSVDGKWYERDGGGKIYRESSSKIYRTVLIIVESKQKTESNMKWIRPNKQQKIVYCEFCGANVSTPYKGVHDFISIKSGFPESCPNNGRMNGDIAFPEIAKISKIQPKGGVKWFVEHPETHLWWTGFEWSNDPNKAFGCDLEFTADRYARFQKIEKYIITEHEFFKLPSKPEREESQDDLWIELIEAMRSFNYKSKFKIERIRGVKEDTKTEKL